MIERPGRPLVGLTTYREDARWGIWDQRADLLPTSYAEMVLAAGGAPVLLPPSAPYDETARAVVGRLDALVVTGGADVDPAAYGAAADPATGVPRSDRDAWELALLDAADERALPALGICRGMQVMAVHGGGALDQHLPDLVGHERHGPAGPTFGDVSVLLDPGSRIGSLLGDRADVRCHHHQAVRVHPGFTAVGWSDDGVVEAIERAGERFCLAVQWHPEAGPDPTVLGALVAAAAIPPPRERR